MSLGGVLSVHLKIELLMPIGFFSETLNFVCFFRSVRVIQLTELDFPRPPTVAMYVSRALCITPGLAEGNGSLLTAKSLYASFSVCCCMTFGAAVCHASYYTNMQGLNQLRNPTLGNRVWATFTFLCIKSHNILAVVKLLSKRWWISTGARPEGPTAEVGFPTADQGLSSIQDTLFGFCGI